MLVVHEGTFQLEVVMISVLLDKRSLSFYSSDNIYTFISGCSSSNRIYYKPLMLIAKYPSPGTPTCQNLFSDRSGLEQITDFNSTGAFGHVYQIKIWANSAVESQGPLYGSNHIFQKLHKGLWKPSNDSAECGNKHPLSFQNLKYYGGLKPHLSKRRKKTAICNSQILEGIVHLIKM